MLLASAVNLFVAAVALAGPQGQLSRSEQAAWDKIRASTITIMDGATPRGMAACIDSDGLFITHRSAARFPLIFAKNPAGAMVEMEVISVDEATQLALLGTKQKGVATGMQPVKAVSSDKRFSSNALIAVLTSGPVRAELVSKDRIGIINPSRRMFSLSEIRFEASQQRIAGSLVFTPEGELLGVVGATLTDNEVMKQDAQFGATGSGGLQQKGFAVNQYGPGELTIAYSVAPNILERVISGFLSPSRKPAHPAIGIVCRDSKEGGAAIEQVNRSSAADKAGLRVGDVIIEIGGETIRDQFAFAKSMQKQIVGTNVIFKVRRNGVISQIDVLIGQG